MLTISVWPPAESFSTKNQNYDHFSMTFKNHVMLTFVVQKVSTRGPIDINLITFINFKYSQK